MCVYVFCLFCWRMAGFYMPAVVTHGRNIARLQREDVHVACHTAPTESREYRSARIDCIAAASAMLAVSKALLHHGAIDADDLSRDVARCGHCEEGDDAGRREERRAGADALDAVYE